MAVLSDGMEVCAEQGAGLAIDRQMLVQATLTDSRTAKTKVVFT